MIVDNHVTVQLVIGDLYVGPARLRDGKLTFPLARITRKELDGTIDGRPVRLRVEQMSASQRAPYAEAFIL